MGRPPDPATCQDMWIALPEAMKENPLIRSDCGYLDSCSTVVGHLGIRSTWDTKSVSVQYPCFHPDNRPVLTFIAMAHVDRLWVVH